MLQTTSPPPGRPASLCHAVPTGVPAPPPVAAPLPAARARHLEDARLMARAAAGDAAACRILHETHLPPTQCLALRMLGDAAEAEDIAQEAFLRLWRHAAAWRPDARVSTWLYRVAHNLCIDRLRRRGRLSDETVPDQADPTPDAPARRAERQMVAVVNAAVEQLPDRQRQAIRLVHHGELGNIEAARRMAVTVEALESLLARGRRTLRVKLREQAPDLLQM